MTDPETLGELPPGDRPLPRDEPAKPSMDAISLAEHLTPDVISAFIKKERETKRAAKRERWANQLFA